ncbi:MAG TPA: 16S rRNA (cytidine(1402)-2'-O)-methyltransferase [Candidatus Kaiserbacteria bacterium]|nr:16S rRNA (cytidine(1402)-2'-O)-methyltransferase [Candidatus Kaiserbacteria bacterium]
MSKLYIVATPIGNLEDITLRAIRTLSEVDMIFCEDTRVTNKLLSRYEIKTPLRRLDANVEKTRAKEVIDRLMGGESIAFVTDAGTPSISDPGYRLVGCVRQTLGDSFPIEPIPGPSALTAALSISGIPSDKFVFLGFLPHKKGRQTLLKEIASIKRAVVLYESPHRILKLLGELNEYIGDREVFVARELTKKFEEVQSGTAEGIKGFFKESRTVLKGEFVVIISEM